MEEWKEYKLGKVAVFSQGIQVGIEKQIETCKEGYVRFIRIVDYTKGIDAPRYILYPGARYIVDETDIVMMRYGTPGKVARGYSGAIANNMFKITVNEDFLNKDYTFYYLSQDSVYRTLVASNSSSTMPAINFKIIEGLDISAPSISEQMRIVKLLKSLDDKIEVNRKINENLEQQAQALYKSWFVDFEPFKGGEFVESELGMIPKGWRVGTLSEISLFSNKKIETSKLTKENYYSTENMLPNKRGVTAASSLPSTLYTPMCTMGDTIISNIRPYFKKIYYCKENIAGCSSDVLCFVPISEEWSEYLFMALYDDNFFDYMMLGTKGTKMPRGDKKQIMKYPLNIPNLDWLTKFNNIVQPIIQQILNNRDESRRLATLRDTLLPKLMSGELKVNEVEI